MVKLVDTEEVKQVVAIAVRCSLLTMLLEYLRQHCHCVLQ